MKYPGNRSPVRQTFAGHLGRPVPLSAFVVNDLFVHESGRRKGLASKLLSAIESYAWSLGAARATLNVARGNTSAQKLYEESGWKQDDQFYMHHRFPENHS